MLKFHIDSLHGQHQPALVFLVARIEQNMQDIFMQQKKRARCRKRIACRGKEMLKHEKNIIRMYTETAVAQDLLMTSVGKERFSSFAAASASKKNKKTTGHKGKKRAGISHVYASFPLFTLHFQMAQSMHTTPRAQLTVIAMMVTLRERKPQNASKD